MAHQPGVVATTPPQPPASCLYCSAHPMQHSWCRGPAPPEHGHSGCQGALGMLIFSHSCHAEANKQLLITDGHGVSHADVSWKQPGQRQSPLPRKLFHSGTLCLAPCPMQSWKTPCRCLSLSLSGPWGTLSPVGEGWQGLGGPRIMLWLPAGELLMTQMGIPTIFLTCDSASGKGVNRTSLGRSWDL